MPRDVDHYAAELGVLGPATTYEDITTTSDWTPSGTKACLMYARTGGTVVFEDMEGTAHTITLTDNQWVAVPPGQSIALLCWVSKVTSSGTTAALTAVYVT